MSNEKMNKPIIIGVDHGFAMMKYANGTFPNGLKRIQGEASLENNTLVVDGQTYKIGEGRLPMKEDTSSKMRMRGRTRRWRRRWMHI